MTEPTPQQLLAALTLSWQADTAYDNDWEPHIPSLNQCVPTALVVQDYYGGKIARAPMSCGGSHYWNVETKYGTLDFSGGQFAYLTSSPRYDRVAHRSRGILLDDDYIVKRYHKLAERVSYWLVIIQAAV